MKKRSHDFSEIWNDIALNSLENIIRYTDSQYIAEEKTVAELLLAAANAKIVTDLKKEGDYFLFSILNRPHKYRVYFGNAPDDVRSFVQAERALPAADPIILLSNIITAGYSFYAAVQEIYAPSTEQLEILLKKTCLFDKTPLNFRVETPKSLDGLTANESFNVSFELELLIELIVDHRDKNGKLTYAYERIFDSLQAELFIAENESKRISYTYNQPLSLDSKISKKPTAAIALLEKHQKEIQRMAEFLFRTISNPYEKLNILNKLKEAEDSLFCETLSTKLEHLQDVKKIGDINVSPSAIYVAPIKEKCFLFDVFINGYGVPIPFYIELDKTLKNVDKKKLYVVLQDGYAIGLTHKKSTDGEIHPQLGVDCDLVVLYGFSNNKLLPVAFSIQPKGEQAQKFNEILRRSVPYTKVSDISPFIKADINALYATNHTKSVDGGIYLSIDCFTCPYTETIHWQGNRSQKPVWFVDKKNRLVQDFIYTSAMQSKHLRTCDICHTQYYANEQRFDTYKNRYALLDEKDKHFCDVCARKIFLDVNKYYALQKVFTPDERKYGFLFVEIPYDLASNLMEERKFPLAALVMDRENNYREDMQSGPIALDRFYRLEDPDASQQYQRWVRLDEADLEEEPSYTLQQCGHCSKLLYLKDDIAIKCDTCNGILGDVCADYIDNNDEFNFINYVSGKKNYCNSCKKNLDESNSYWQIIEDVYFPITDTLGKVLEERKGVSKRVYACASCDKLLYHTASTEQAYKHCSACGRPVCNACQHTLKRNLLGDAICPICQEIELQGKEYDGKNYTFTEAFNALQRLKYQEEKRLQDLERFIEQEREDVKEYVLSHVEQCLPYVKYSDAKWLVKMQRWGHLRELVQIDVNNKDFQSNSNYKIFAFDLVLQPFDIEKSRYRFLYTKNSKGKIIITPYS